MDYKKIILPAAIVVMVGAFVLYKSFSGTPVSQAPVNNNQNSASNETTNPNQNNSSNPPATQTGYKDGQYTGEVANTIYGDVQVSVVITGGKITDIKMLKTPSKPGHTADLVASSFPILQSEAMASQKANVDIVSGATQNSEGFSQSLASALSKAV